MAIQHKSLRNIISTPAKELVLFMRIQHKLLEVELVKKFWKIGCLAEIRAFNKTGLCCNLISKEN